MGTNQQQGQRGSSQDVDSNENFSSSQDQRTSQKDSQQDSQKWQSEKQAPRSGNQEQSGGTRQATDSKSK